MQIASNKVTVSTWSDATGCEGNPHANNPTTNTGEVTEVAPTCCDWLTEGIPMQITSTSSEVARNCSFFLVASRHFAVQRGRKIFTFKQRALGLLVMAEIVR